MGDDNEKKERFGCDRCWPSAADAAWAARNGLTFEGKLVDDSHYGLSIRSCPVCHQRFMTIFQEVVDWVGGDDAQYWKTCPITAEEADKLIARKSDLHEFSDPDLNSKRPWLHADFPTGKPSHIFFQ